MYRLFSVCFLVMCINFVSPLYADTQIFERTVKQLFGGSQSPDDARVGAIAKAKREVLEEAGTYLESLTIVTDGRMDSDRILAMSSAIFNVEVVSEKPFVEGNSYGIIINTRIKVDTSTLEQRVRDLSNDKEKQNKFQQLEGQNTKLLAKLKRLEAENNYLKNNPEQKTASNVKRIKREFKEVTRGLTASQWLEKVFSLWVDNKHSNPREALKYLNKAIELDPKYASAYHLRGIAYAVLEEYRRAIKDYNKAIELNPELDDALSEIYSNRGHAYSYLKDNRRAIKDCNKAIELDPKNAFAYLNRGFAYYSLKEYRRAISDYNKAIELDQNKADLYVRRGVAYLRLKEYRRAISDYNKAIELDQKKAGLYFGRGTAYRMLEEYRKAISDYSKVIELNPNDAEAYKVRGMGYLLLEEYRKAISDYSKVIELNPKDVEAYKNRGLAYFPLKDIYNACLDFERACKLGAETCEICQRN
jgi:tetratricopeptide (TPR) repeat protein